MRKDKDLTGLKFGEWQVLYKDKENSKGHIRWICRCSCGNVKSVMGTHLKSGASLSCGCVRNKDSSIRRTADLQGKKFGQLTAIENTRVATKNGFLWKCKCDCGNIVEVAVYDLTSGKITACDECKKHGFKSIKEYAAYKRSLSLIKENGSLMDLLLLKYSDIEPSDIWSDKNDRSPHELTAKSHRDVYIMCPKCGKEYKTSALALYSRVYDLMCPDCLSDTTDSSIELAVKHYINGSLNLQTLHEYACTIVPINPRTGSRMPFDNEIVGRNIIIEVHGIQHYLPCAPKCWLGDKTQDEWLKDLQWRDNYKMEYAKSCGYKYLALSYVEIMDGSFKAKINNILGDNSNEDCI